MTDFKFLSKFSSKIETFSNKKTKTKTTTKKTRTPKPFGLKKNKAAPKPKEFSLPPHADKSKLIMRKTYASPDYSTYQQTHSDNLTVAEALLEIALEDVRDIINDTEHNEPFLDSLIQVDHHFRQQGFFVRYADTKELNNFLSITVKFLPNYTREYRIRLNKDGKQILALTQEVTCSSTVIVTDDETDATV